ncbi:unnamed protein product [Chrysoparadoxa australica]
MIILILFLAMVCPGWTFSTLPLSITRLRAFSLLKTQRTNHESVPDEKMLHASIEAIPNLEDVDAMKLAELKELCRGMGLPVSGRKGDVRNRVLKAMVEVSSKQEVPSPQSTPEPEAEDEPREPPHILDDDELLLPVQQPEELPCQPVVKPSQLGAAEPVARDEQEEERPERPRTFSPRRRRESYEPAPGEVKYFASCVRGLEQVLKRELEGPNIRAVGVAIGFRGVTFFGDKGVGYRALIWLRSAHKVLELIAESDNITSPEDLHDFVSTVDWGGYMRVDNTLQTEVMLGKMPAEGLTHTHFSALTIKNSIVDQFRDRYNGERPSVAKVDPDLSVSVFLDGSKASLYRSWSGAVSLHKRGYRDRMHAASLKETIAAGLLLASSWDPDTQSLADPMCGSGTLAIEAALIAMRRAPLLQAMGYYSRNCDGKYLRPCIMQWPDFDQALWEELVEAAKAHARPAPQAILANDWHNGALQLAYENAEDAGVLDAITLYNDDVRELALPVTPDLVVTNPPWEMRLESDGSWEALAQFLRRTCGGRTAWVLSGSRELPRRIGMSPAGQFKLAFGGLPDVRYYQFHVHEAKPHKARMDSDYGRWESRGRGQVGKRSNSSRVPW